MLKIIKENKMICMVSWMPFVLLLLLELRHFGRLHQALLAVQGKTDKTLEVE